MPLGTYTFDDMRTALVRQRSESSMSRHRAVFSDPEPLNIVRDRMIALIDAMTPDERKLSNVLQLSNDRQEELASIAGTSIREVQGLMAGRRSVEFVNQVYLPQSH